MKFRLLALILPSVSIFLFLYYGPDEDYDGVVNLLDQCPHTAQLKKVPRDFPYRMAVNPDRFSEEPVSWPVDFRGCEPDSDNDSIINSEDYCPGIYRKCSQKVSRRMAVPFIATRTARLTTGTNVPGHREEFLQIRTDVPLHCMMRLSELMYKNLSKICFDRWIPACICLVV